MMKTMKKKVIKLKKKHKFQKLKEKNETELKFLKICFVFKIWLRN